MRSIIAALILCIGLTRPGGAWAEAAAGETLMRGKVILYGQDGATLDYEVERPGRLNLVVGPGNPVRAFPAVYVVLERMGPGGGPAVEGMLGPVSNTIEHSMQAPAGRYQLRFHHTEPPPAYAPIYVELTLTPD